MTKLTKTVCDALTGKTWQEELTAEEIAQLLDPADEAALPISQCHACSCPDRLRNNTPKRP